MTTVDESEVLVNGTLITVPTAPPPQLPSSSFDPYHPSNYYSEKGYALRIPKKDQSTMSNSAKKEKLSPRVPGPGPAPRNGGNHSNGLSYRNALYKDGRIQSQEQANREQANRERANREAAMKDQAAREAANREQDREQAIREAANLEKESQASKNIVTPKSAIKSCGTMDMSIKSMATPDKPMVTPDKRTVHSIKGTPDTIATSADGTTTNRDREVSKWGTVDTPEVLRRANGRTTIGDVRTPDGKSKNWNNGTNTGGNGNGGCGVGKNATPATTSALPPIFGDELNSIDEYDAYSQHFPPVGATLGAGKTKTPSNIKRNQLGFPSPNHAIIGAKKNNVIENGRSNSGLNSNAMTSNKDNATTNVMNSNAMNAMLNTNVNVNGCMPASRQGPLSKDGSLVNGNDALSTTTPTKFNTPQKNGIGTAGSTPMNMGNMSTSLSNNSMFQTTTTSPSNNIMFQSGNMSNNSNGNLPPTINGLPSNNVLLNSLNNMNKQMPNNIGNSASNNMPNNVMANNNSNKNLTTLNQNLLTMNSPSTIINQNNSGMMNTKNTNVLQNSTISAPASIGGMSTRICDVVGVIRMFSPIKGWGFISCAEFNGDVFLHTKHITSLNAPLDYVGHYNKFGSGSNYNPFFPYLTSYYDRYGNYVYNPALAAGMITNPYGFPSPGTFEQKHTVIFDLDFSNDPLKPQALNVRLQSEMSGNAPTFIPSIGMGRGGIIPGTSSVPMSTVTSSPVTGGIGGAPIINPSNTSSGCSNSDAYQDTPKNRHFGSRNWPGTYNCRYGVGRRHVYQKNQYRKGGGWINGCNNGMGPIGGNSTYGTGSTNTSAGQLMSSDISDITNDITRDIILNSYNNGYNSPIISSPDDSHWLWYLDSIYGNNSINSTIIDDNSCLHPEGIVNPNTSAACIAAGLVDSPDLTTVPVDSSPSLHPFDLSNTRDSSGLFNPPLSSGPLISSLSSPLVSTSPGLDPLSNPLYLTSDSFGGPITSGSNGSNNNGSGFSNSNSMSNSIDNIMNSNNANCNSNSNSEGIGTNIKGGTNGGSIHCNSNLDSPSNCNEIPPPPPPPMGNGNSPNGESNVDIGNGDSNVDIRNLKILSADLASNLNCLKDLGSPELVPCCTDLMSMKDERLSAALSQDVLFDAEYLQQFLQMPNTGRNSTDSNDGRGNDGVNGYSGVNKNGSNNGVNKNGLLVGDKSSTNSNGTMNSTTNSNGMNSTTILNAMNGNMGNHVGNHVGNGSNENMGSNNGMNGNGVNGNMSMNSDLGNLQMNNLNTSTSVVSNINNLSHQSSCSSMVDPRQSCKTDELYPLSGPLSSNGSPHLGPSILGPGISPQDCPRLVTPHNCPGLVEFSSLLFPSGGSSGPPTLPNLDFNRSTDFNLLPNIDFNRYDHYDNVDKNIGGRC